MREELKKLLKEADSDVCKIVQNRFPSDVRTVWDLLTDQLIAKDVVPVLRCKNCEHYQEETVSCPYSVINRYPNDFCSYGKKRDGGNEDG